MAFAATILSVTALQAQSRLGVQQANINKGVWEQVAPGLQRQWFTGSESTFAYWKMDKGAHVPAHQHPNEQTTYITSGSAKVLMNGKEYVLTAGDVLIIPPNVTHEFFALEDGTVDIDFFSPSRKDWLEGTAGYLPQQNKVLEEVAALSERPGNVAVSADGRVFATIHPLGNPKLQLVEIKNKEAVAYPSVTLQKNGSNATDETIDSPLGIVFDKKNRLWIVDMGQNIGKTRLWCFDIQKNKVIEKIALPQSIAPKGSFIQDLVIDEKNNWAYLADIANPGIIAVNLSTKKASRFGNHASLQAEDKDMVIDGRLTYFGGQPARVAVDPITISADRETIFFGAMNGTTWYKVPARLFRENTDNKTIATAIQVAGVKPISDGALTDAQGNHYFTNLAEHAITKVGADGKMVNIIKDHRILWPDNVAMGPGGWLYISANQLNTTPAFTGSADEGKAPYYIYRFKQ